MSRIHLLATSLLTVGLVIGGGVAQADMPTAVGEGEGKLTIIAWAGYIERGETDPNYDWVTGFEKDTGCKVDVKTAGSSDEMFNLMKNGGFDLVTASGDASLRLIKSDLVQPINVDLIPSYKNVDDRLKDAPWHTVDGKHYGTPYQWGPNVLMYNADVFKDAPKSWDVVFKEQNLPDGKSNAKRVQAYSGPIYIADAALFLMKHNPELGIKDPYALDAAQFDAVKALLTEQSKILQRYWKGDDVAAQMADFTNEGVVASTSWPYQVNALKAEGKINIASTVPEEGATGWADTTMMHAKAEHPNCAYKWMEHSLSPDVQGAVAAWFGSVPAVPAACKGNALLGDEGCATNGFDNFDKIYFWKTPIKECGEGRECVSYKDWLDAYTSIKSAAGQ
jgi:putative spermidine/putrescine transport system substrate-binding protein